MAALDQHGHAVARVKLLRGAAHAVPVADRPAAQGLRLRDIGRDDPAQRQKPLHKGVLRVLREQPGAACRDHDRVEHDIFRPVQAQPARYGGNDVRVGYHADFHGVGPDV